MRERLDTDTVTRTRVPSLAYHGMRLQFPSGWEHVPFGPLTATRVAVDHSFEEMVAIRDALILLSILARMDAQAYEFVLTKYCDVMLEDEAKVTEEGDFFRPRFMIEMTQSEIEEWMPTMLDAFFSDRNAALSDKLAEATRRIVENCEPGVLQREPLDIQVALSVYSNARSHPPIVENIYRLLKAAQRASGGWRFPVVIPPSADGKKSPLECAFVVEPLDVALSTGGLLLTEAELIGRLVVARDDCPLSRVSVMTHITEDAGLDAARAAQAVGKMVGRVLCASGCLDEMPPNLEEVEFSASMPNLAAAGRICSALAETQTTDTVKLSCGRHHEEDEWEPRFWAYIAHAFFSAHAQENSSITTLSLDDTELTVEAADAFAAALAADDPVSCVYGRHGFSTEGSAATTPLGRSRDRWMLKQGSAVTIQAMDPGEVVPVESASWELEDDVFGVRVLGSDEPESGERTVRVLVPGFGVCKVPRDQLVAARETQRVGGVVTCLELGNVQEEGAYRFLDLVGSSLIRLQLDFNTTFDQNFSRIFQACPNLETLIIGRPDVNAEAFLRAYRGSSAHIVELECCFDSLGAIADELADSSTRLARTVKRLAYRSYQR